MKEEQVNPQMIEDLKQLFTSGTKDIPEKLKWTLGVYGYALYSEPQVDKAYLNFEPPEKPQVCPACKGSGQAHYQRGLNDTPAIVEIRDCPDCNGTGCIPVPSTLAKEVKGVNKFRKKPVVIEALQFTGTNWYEIGAFAGKKADIAHKTGEPDVCLIKTLEGEMRASKGDWIIKGVKGEFYPCKPDIFQQTYEAVNSTPANVPLPDELLKEIKELPEFIEYRDAIRTQHNHPFSIEYMRTFEAEDKLISAILLKCHQSEAAIRAKAFKEVLDEIEKHCNLYQWTTKPDFTKRHYPFCPTDLYELKKKYLQSTKGGG